MVFASRTTHRHQMHCGSKMVVNYFRRMYRVCFLFLYYGRINYGVFNFRLSIDSNRASPTNVWVAKKDTKHSTNTLLCLVSVFATQTLPWGLALYEAKWTFNTAAPNCSVWFVDILVEGYCWPTGFLDKCSRG